MALTLDHHQRATAVQQQLSYIMANELRLMPPARYLLTERNERVWLLAVLNRMALGRPVEAYFGERVVDHLRAVLALPVVGIMDPWLCYAILLSGKPKLPVKVDFPEMELQRDVFALGVGLRGEVKLRAARMQNVIIGARQEKGKSNVLKLLVHTGRRHGWSFYLCDVQGHTFNPDVWNGLAMAPVASNAEELRGLVGQISGELASREALYRASARRSGGIPPVDLDAYNKVNEQPLGRFALVVDEANSLLESPALQKAVTDVARQGRKFGLHVILAGHNWRAKDISRELSTLFPTRIALAVADDTSAQVVLESVRWGKWVMNKAPGRGVIGLDGMFTPIQFYYIPPAMEAGWMENAATQVFSALTSEELALVRYAIEKLEGEFKISELVAEFGNSGWSEWRLRKLAEEWETRGWLGKRPDAVTARPILSKLAGLAGLALAGSHVSQALAGVSDGSQVLSQDSQEK